ncbi:MAG: ATP-binding cassette domain-containing protein [Clostridia bacterium]|nr:ATP-binding cassette domain-containing protein [Clostridia bacterium]
MERPGEERGHGHRPAPRRFSGRFPAELENVLRDGGLDTSGLLYCAEGDMNNERCFCSCWLCFDEKGLYIAYGNAEVKPAKRKKHITTVYTLDSIRSIPMDEIDSLEAERYVTTGRLVLSLGEQKESVTFFSIGKFPVLDDFCRKFNSYKKGEKIKRDDAPPPDRVCPKCHMPIPDGKPFCPKCNKKSSIAIRLFKYFSDYKGKVALITVLILAQTALNIYIPQISTRRLIDEVLTNPDALLYEQSIKALAVLILTMAGLRLLNQASTSLYQFVIGSVMPRFIYDIKVRIFSAMQRLSVGFYSSKQTGSLMERVTRDANNIYWFFVDGFPYIFVNGLTIIGVSVIMFSMSWKLSLIILGIVPFLVAVLVLGDRIFHSLHHRTWLFSARVSSTVSDNINGQRIIKAFSKEDDEYGKFERKSHDLLDAERKLNLTEATVLPIFMILVLALSTVVLCIGGTMVVKGDITAGTLLSFIVYIGMLQEPFRFLTWISNWWSRCADSAQRMFEIVDTEPEITEKENAVSFENLRGSISIKELDFEYEAARPIIKKLNLEVNAGEMLGIVGKTGAGKTTIANLIARLYDAKSGTVEIDGTDVRDLKLDELRKNIGMVSQDIYLFMGTIADNIRYAKPDASMREVIAAAKAASAHDFIMKLPGGYETFVGAGGQELSGGERQRISIARTIIQNPKILILDEATAAMDTKTERNIQASLSVLKQGRTTISIAHRLSTLRDADHLAVIDEGTIKEYGTYTELLEKKGEFYKLYKIQSEALKTIGIGDDENE